MSKICLDHACPACRRGVPRGWYRLRWAAWYPLQWRLPGSGGRVTLGEALVVLAVLAGAAAALGCTWQESSGSGLAAAVPLILVLTLPAHNSIWTFLIGLPFERALWWHALMAYLTVGMGAYHGLVCWKWGYPSNTGEVTIGDMAANINGYYFYTGGCIGVFSAVQ